jgi:hypothetical protein
MKFGNAAAIILLGAAAGTGCGLNGVKHYTMAEGEKIVDATAYLNSRQELVSYSVSISEPGRHVIDGRGIGTPEPSLRQVLVTCGHDHQMKSSLYVMEGGNWTRLADGLDDVDKPCPLPDNMELIEKEMLAAAKQAVLEGK